MELTKMKKDDLIKYARKLERQREQSVLKVLKVAKQNEWCEQVFEALKVAGQPLPDIYWVEESGERYDSEKGQYVQAWHRSGCEWGLTLEEAKQAVSDSCTYREQRIYFKPAKGRGKVVWSDADE